MRYHWPRLRHAGLRRRSGQGLVEFVLVAPILLLLLFGIIEFALAWNIRHIVTDAAREGTRNLVLCCAHDTAAAGQVVRNILTNSGLDPNIATITSQNSGGVEGQPATMIVTYPYQLRVIKALLGWTGQTGNLNIRTKFVMRNE